MAKTVLDKCTSKKEPGKVRVRSRFTLYIEREHEGYDAGYAPDDKHVAMLIERALTEWRHKRGMWPRHFLVECIKAETLDEQDTKC